jgi:hypothetical protein
MFRQRWLTVGLVVIGAAVAVVVWGPWPAPQPPTPSVSPAPTVDSTEVIKAAMNVDSGRMVTIVCVKAAGGPCKVTVTGGHGNSHGDLTANLQEGEGRSMMMVSGPYTIESVTVERAGVTKRHELKITIPGGETREVRVREDDSVAVVSPQ